MVMLSGGGDSTALLVALAEQVPAARIDALHVNHGLRADQSDADEVFCRELCARLGVGLRVVTAGPPGVGNLQDWARNLRYSAADEWAEELAGGPGQEVVVLTAHSADDQAETVLYRLFASPGRRALAGIPERRGRIARPLLGVRREELRHWLKVVGHSWREDASNDDPRFARVRARALLADAEELHPAAVPNLLQTIEDLADESAALAAVVEREALQLTREDDSLDLAALAELPPPIAAAALRHFVEARRPVAVPKVARSLDEVLRLGHSSEPRELQVEGARLAIQGGRARVIAED